MTSDAAIVGVGIHPFGRHEPSGLDQGVIAIRDALRDAGLGWHDVEFAVGGSTAAGHADSLVGRLGLTGIPFVNVVNGCATGGSALAAAVQAIRSGQHDVGLVVGFDKHTRGVFGADPESIGLPGWYGSIGLMLTTQFFALKAQRYLHEHGMRWETLGTVAAKAFRNGALNENAWRRKPLSEEEILSSPMVSHPLTRYMFCSPGEGAVALVVAHADLAVRSTTKPVYVRAALMRTRTYGSFEVFSPALAVERGDSPTVAAARDAFAEASVEPSDVDIAQLQDTDAAAEVIHMAESGLCQHGEQEELIRSGETAIGGRLPINTDGGCLANGEPIGASGLRQIYESVLQLRGHAGSRQVPQNPRVAFTHVYGAPGVSACTVLTR
jgi:acetyl-CoA C-acetyltransferase